MADDIDDLLDEVETKFVKKKGVDKPISQNKLPRRRHDEDVDDLLNDIVCGDSDVKKPDVVRKPSQTRLTSSKCFPLCIGGASVAKGYGNSVNKRSCDTMRCTSCDFRVASFDDFDWDKTTDYLFLRNNAPDFDRLKPKLNRKRGYRSYCCQCSHIAVNILAEVKDLQVKWVCGQH